MKLIDGTIRLSPTDLANHLACPHLTTLELAVARGEMKGPEGGLPMADALRARGEMHEASYVEHLRTKHPVIVDLREHKYDAAGLAATHDAMERGVAVITQAPLALRDDGRVTWVGRADILLKVDTPSALGAWSYVPFDTKLAKETRGSAVLQLCTYSLMLEALQGQLPEWFAVIAPGDPFIESRYRMADFSAYMRFVRRRLDAALATHTKPYPSPVEHCDVCRWWKACADRRRADDHLSLVAGIRKSQIAELELRALNTLARLGDAPLPFTFKPERGSIESLTRAREQARIQLEGRRAGKHLHQLLVPIEKERGLAELPAPSDGDIFFDFEGDPFVGKSGLEYLWGYVEHENGAWTYRERWSVTLDEEKEAFEAFVDRVMAHWAKDPGMHIYHYAAYEPSAMKRLMGRHATRQDEVDRMLRGGLFVDLYAIVRQSLRASVERYSIKNLEPLYDFTRAISLDQTGPQLRAVEYALEMNDPGGVTPELRAAVASYNKDDCVSALKLRDWLEALRADLEASGTPVPRPVAKADAPSEQLSEWLARVEALRARLLAGVPTDTETRTEEQQARWLLAHTLDFHRREDKATHFEKYRLNKLPNEDYLDEPAALDGLEFVAEIQIPRARTPTHRYRFPSQDFGHREKDVYVSRPEDPSQIGSLVDLDLRARTIDIKKTTASANLHPQRVFLHGWVRPHPIPDALFRLGEHVATNGVDGAGAHRAVRRLLANEGPALLPDAPWRIDGETSLERAKRLALTLDHSVLAIQGPPGSGKTFTGARIVLDLVKAGKKVGVIATGHKVIRNFLDGVAEAAAELGREIPCVYKVSEESDDCPDWLTETTDNAGVRDALASGEALVAGGTAWMWSREDFIDSLDVLIVDEAGQISLANVLAAGQAAKSIILLGDPQQLDQPLKGSHPDGVAVSALQHVLGESETIPEDRGLFLEETWRLHPAVCAYTSEVFYEGRLHSREGRERLALRNTSPLDAPGLYFVPIAHEGNRNCSYEEVDAVVALAQDLVARGEWRNHKDEWRRIGWNDVLIVAPYNAQVYAIAERLPGARAGTVDKFQGQEAPIVIYSMATSSPEDAPRGMEFLYSLNRLNVATSRAQCACVLFASPKLLEPECHTPRQMKLANAFCRYLEMATPIDVSGTV